MSKKDTWTNVEDEIVKAAIAKYGLNQWARVSSLLSHKTPKQVKARWDEWLDPNIKKRAWSPEEDRKLLRLAKLMPTQWRTIGPLLDRTANQCLERYQALLGGNDESGTSSASLVPGEIDAIAEMRPAVPDAIDMDDDELEMLAEARARLLNTQGKKAKRKERERVTKESTRIANLQKQRELKAAGINIKTKPKKSKTHIDYNEEIPFELKPAPGFYDTTQEEKANILERDKHRNEMFSGKASAEGAKDNDAQSKNNQTRKRVYKDNLPKAVDTAAMKAKAERELERYEQDRIAKRRKMQIPDNNDVEMENTVARSDESLFITLPETQNEIDYVDMNEEESENLDVDSGTALPEDKGLIAQAAARKAHQLKLESRSQVLKKNLPRISDITGLKKLMNESKNIENPVIKSINKTMLDLIVSDNTEYPIGETNELSDGFILSPVDQDRKKEIKEAVEEEMAANTASLQLPGDKSFDDTDAQSIAELLEHKLSILAAHTTKRLDSMSSESKDYREKALQIRTELAGVIKESGDALRSLWEYKYLLEAEENAIEMRANSYENEARRAEQLESTAREIYLSTHEDQKQNLP
ncbi:hypothetical protein CANCADRAFT_31653 [Tortispora caseinolytica NRRL Y-17796]|uniref:Pre-mRNA-splicing factor CEF1 n=1 Tax=Tortispora caseinolytica NRRL Y-17796 TaxID=767744 RepID=A0A1E4TGG2_9ASCO|nr:hypothetical protein CANCADRAFT_31653 [Tortispora caseinolytica NRRL Y-17796]